MPTYEYKCKACGHQFEIFQFMSDEPLKQCPVCNGKIERLIGAGGGLIFKGSGFYATDYRSDSYKKAAKEEKSSGPAEKIKSDSSRSRSDAAGAKKEVTARDA